MDNYTSDSSDSDSSEKVYDLAYLLLDPQIIDQHLQSLLDTKGAVDVENIILHHNQLNTFPKNIIKFANVTILDISNNGLEDLPNIFESCPNLNTLIAKNNLLKNEALPKEYAISTALRELNLSGNLLDLFPEQILNFLNLKYLYLGGNQIRSISKNISKLNHLQILSIGGNYLSQVPSTLGRLKHLQALVLCDNKIEHLPPNIANLNNLKSLLLHKNKLRTLPPEIIALKNLTELSLRDNPLVVHFVSNMSHNPASLLELSARTVKLHNITVKHGDLPNTVLSYLNTAHHCLNPNCKGVYFDNRVEHVKFVDFCGKYRIPLLQYLCSAKCATDNDEIRPSRNYLMKKVLLG